ncbi:hypothetical protein GC170_22710 [bacterium]|nr:hypothetical protein [bacterium]
MDRNMWRTIIPIVVILHGCGGDQPFQSTAVDRVPVSGRVVVGRQPVAGAIVTFEPKFDWDPELPKPSAVTDAEGKFDIGTRFDADGAPAGEYLVSIKSPEAEGSIQLDAQFGEASRSGLKASISDKPVKLPDFVVKRGSNPKK